MKTRIFLKSLIPILCASIIGYSGLLSGCGSSSSSSSSAAAETSETSVKESTNDEAKFTDAADTLKSLGIDADALGISPSINYDNHEVGFQLEMPSNGDTIAILHTTEGDITMRFFPEQAPKTVENFIELAKDGRFDNISFYRVIDDFMIQTGAEDTSSYYGENFEDEFCDKLFNIRGAVSMANSGADTNGSQFFINQKDAEAFSSGGGWSSLESNWSNIKIQLQNISDSDVLSEYLDYYSSACCNTDIISDDIRKLYEENGGNPHLDGAYNAADRGHTVFAQVIDGMDVVDKIASSETDENDKPVSDILVESVEITTYSAD